MAIGNPSLWDEFQVVAANAAGTGQIEHVQFVGHTSNATAKEIFLGVVSNNLTQRLQLPNNSISLVEFKALGIIDTNTGDIAHHVSRGAFSVRRSGTTSFVVSGTDAGWVASSGNPAIQAIKGTAGHVAFAVNDTNDYVTCTVTGVAATEISWLVVCDILCMQYPNVHKISS